MTRASSTKTNAPKVWTVIVWRFTGNKGWRIGTVRDVMAQGRIVQIHETAHATFSDDNVALADIEWYSK